MFGCPPLGPILALTAAYGSAYCIVRLRPGDGGPVADGKPGGAASEKAPYVSMLCRGPLPVPIGGSVGGSLSA